MKWGNVKWLLILCLFLADSFLGFRLYLQYQGEHTVSRAAVEDVAALLADAEIFVSPDVVPTEIVKDYVYKIAPDGDAYSMVLSAMAGSPVAGTYLLASSGISLLFENGDTAEYYQNLFFTYRRKTNSAEDGTWDMIVSAYTENPAAFVKADKAHAHTAQETAEVFLTGFGSTSAAGTVSGGMRLRAVTDAVYKTARSQAYLVVLHEELSRTGSRLSVPITGTQLLLLVENDAVQYLSGTWIPFVPDETASTTTLDQLNLLYAEKRRRTTAEGAPWNPRVLTKMESTYYMLWDDANNVYLRPAWSLTYEEDGLQPWVTLCDAVTGSVVSETSNYLSNISDLENNRPTDLDP